MFTCLFFSISMSEEVCDKSTDLGFRLYVWWWWCWRTKWNLSWKVFFVCSRLRDEKNRLVFFCFLAMFFFVSARDTNLAQRFFIDCKVFFRFLFFLWVDYWLFVCFFDYLRRIDDFFLLLWLLWYKGVVRLCYFSFQGSVCQQNKKWFSSSGAMVVCLCVCVSLRVT